MIPPDMYYLDDTSVPSRFIQNFAQDRKVKISGPVEEYRLIRIV